MWGAKIDSSRFLMPEGATLHEAPSSELAAEGEKLWNDRSLGKSGIACATCHYDSYGQMADTFDQPYPHFVKMPHDRAGVSEVRAAEMVNFCMLVPMQDEPLPWDSRELAALTAYVEHLQADFEPEKGGATAANPCNPCGGRGNPCSPKNPCNP